MPRAQYQSTSIPVDELEKWRRFLSTADARFDADTATSIDIIRTLYKLASASAKNELQSVHNSVHSGSDNIEPVSQRNVHAQKESEQRTEKLRMESLVLAQKITLEDRKRKREYWRAVASGKVAAPQRFTDPAGTAVPRSTAFYCRLHQTTHPAGPCKEIEQFQKDLVSW